MKKLKEFSGILKTTGLFHDIETSDLRSMLTCIGARTRRIRRGSYILLAGDKPEFVGIVLSGQLHIIREDYNGNRSIVAAIMPGGILAEALCAAGVSESPVTIIAAADSTVMLLNFPRILHNCPNTCLFHRKLIKNLLQLVANKNLFLQSKMEILSLKSVREKVMLYLESFVPKQGKTIKIPFNREEMADYLCVERSALSHELMKMKKDGLIDYRKNVFTLMAGQQVLPNLEP